MKNILVIAGNSGYGNYVLNFCIIYYYYFCFSFSDVPCYSIEFDDGEYCTESIEDFHSKGSQWRLEPKDARQQARFKLLQEKKEKAQKEREQREKEQKEKREKVKREKEQQKQLRQQQHQQQQQEKQQQQQQQRQQQ